MSFDEFEVIARLEIENYLNKPESKSTSQLFHFDFTDYLVLKWRNTTDTADVRFAINHDSEYLYIEYTLTIEYDAGEDEDDYHSHGKVDDIPTSEEDYFQKSTVQDLGFRWEFYQYLYNFFEMNRKKVDNEHKS